MKRLKKQLCTALRAHLVGGKAPLPEVGRLLLDAFNALSRARSYTGAGPNPITWEALAAWSQVMRVPVQPRHAAIIMTLDQVWMDAAYRQTAKTPEGIKTPPPVSAQPLTAALFDVIAG